MTDDAAATNRSAGIRLLQLAVERGLLTEQQFETVAGSTRHDVCDHAVEASLISSADVDMLRPLAEPETFLPGYEFLDVVGVGATGAVYKARDTKLDRMVALKLLKPSVLQSDSATARSRIEARIGASLQHPNVVVVHDYGVHHQRIFLAQEFIEGESLQDLIEREGALSADCALDIVQQVVSALDDAAAAGIVHRDIKPANLLLMDRGSKRVNARGPLVKVTDFGLAFRRVTSTDATRLTVDGATLGTPSYAAPEQLVDSTVDHRADIYSLGATLYHMVTGQQPFHGANAFKAIADKMSGNEEWRTAATNDLPSSLRALILDMTHHRVEDRIASYQELAERLQRIVDGADEPLPQLEPLPLQNQLATAATAPTWLPSIGSKPLLMALLTAVLVGGAIWAALQSPPIMPQNVVVAGGPTWLFNGQELPDRRHRQAALGGSFWVDADREGVSVLRGDRAAIHFQIPEPAESSPDLFQFSTRLELVDEGATADICFAVSADGMDYRALRVGPDGVQFGAGTDIESERAFMVFTESPTVPLRQPRDDSPVYQVVVVEKHQTGWFVTVNEQLVGSCELRKGQLREVVIRANDGAVNFADLKSVPLKPGPG